MTDDPFSLIKTELDEIAKSHQKAMSAIGEVHQSHLDKVTRDMDALHDASSALNHQTSTASRQFTTNVQAAETIVRSINVLLRKNHTVWVILGCMLVALLGLPWVAYQIGSHAGQTEGLTRGYNEAANEIKAAKWGATSEGRRIKAWFDNGGKEMIFKCGGSKHWQVIEGRCYPFPNAKNQTTGWLMTESPSLRLQKTPHRPVFGTLLASLLVLFRFWYYYRRSHIDLDLLGPAYSITSILNETLHFELGYMREYRLAVLAGNFD